MRPNKSGFLLWVLLLLSMITGVNAYAAWPFPVEKVDHVVAYQDIRWKDLSDQDASMVRKYLGTFWMNGDVIWPDASLEQEADAIIKGSVYPGLGVGELHGQGITGQGVRVAIIDQDLCGEHPEFAGKIVEQRVFPERVPRASMHGPAVASLLVGTNCGTAPGARLYYASACGFEAVADAKPIAQALNWITDTNERLPEGDKVRVVSISAAPYGRKSPFKIGTKDYDDAVQRAIKAGILVLDCTDKYGFIAPCFMDPKHPDDFDAITPGFPSHPGLVTSWPLLVPCSPRTTAELYISSGYGYQYMGEGGLSWSIPYAAGVLAMGWQVDPTLTKEQILAYLWKSAYINKDGYKIINPQGFVRMVQEGKGIR